MDDSVDLFASSDSCLGSILCIMQDACGSWAAWFPVDADVTYWLSGRNPSSPLKNRIRETPVPPKKKSLCFHTFCTKKKEKPSRVEWDTGTTDAQKNTKRQKRQSLFYIFFQLRGDFKGYSNFNRKLHWYLTLFFIFCQLFGDVKGYSRFLPETTFFFEPFYQNDWKLDLVFS